MSKDEKVLKTEDLNQDERKAKKPFLKTQDLKLGKHMQLKPRQTPKIMTRELGRGGKIELSDGQFIGKFANGEDLKTLRANLEERLAQRPRPPFYYRCDKCAWIMKAVRQVESGIPCLACNRKQIIGGGILEPLTSKKEIQAYEEGILKRLQETAALAKRMAKASYESWKQRVASGEFSK
jgi:hypothetical protein